MPNRGKLMYNEQCEYEQIMVYNTIKRILCVGSIPKKSAQKKIEKALKTISHKVYTFMKEFEGGADADEDAGRVIDSLAELKVLGCSGLDPAEMGLPVSLGRDNARTIYDELVGVCRLDATIEYVHHKQAPAPVGAWTSQSQSDPGVAHDLGNLSDDDSVADSLDDSQDAQASDRRSVALSEVFVLTYKRSPKEFRNALLMAPQLAECRQALEAVNLSSTLAGGAKVFVQPPLYQSVVNALRRRRLNLKARHVICAGEFLQSLKDATMPIGKGVEITSEDPFWEFDPQRTSNTFIELEIPSSLRSEPNSDPSAKSTTDGNPRTLARPRTKAHSHRLCNGPPA